MNKDGTNATGVNGRKASMSHSAGNAFGMSSPSSVTRPGTRRRETVDTNTIGLNSPTAVGRTGREEVPFWLPRKTGDPKETETEEPESEQHTRDATNKLPFGNLMRSNTAGSAGMGSIWSQSNPGTPGAGGFGNFALGGSTVGDKRTGTTGGGSRLFQLMPKDNAESGGRSGEGQNPLSQSSWRSRQRTDTDPFGEDGPSGSAALGGAQETSAAPSQSGHVGTLGTPVKGSAGDFGMSGLHLGDQHDDNSPASPSETNPYRSPPAERHDHDEGDAGAPKGYSGFPLETSAGFNPLQRAISGVPEGHDRSQTSSAGAKGFPLSHMSAWTAPGGPSNGTPDRERSNFASGPFSPALFNSMGDIQSPSLGDLSGLFGPGSAGGTGTNSIGRGSKMGTLFPPAMQAQMQQQLHEQNEGLGDSAADPRHTNPLGAIGRNNFPMPMRNTESPMRSSRGVFEELFPSNDAGRSQGLYGTAEPNQPGATATASQSFTPVSGGMSFGGNQAAVEPPSAQARTMVMPDRMRWVYLDPQGQIQGPFTGLEMNDWYKAHFFTPDLRVKKVEDVEFEPLGQLIRRIGNSREPFLVPQVGIAHGPPASAPGFPTTNSGGVVPPLSGVFPSFGRTLTAEEQNNLERRKQEEQYIMAQQREYAMRQHAMTRFQGQQPGLQHHSSAHSLQSQPSFGSITSPMGVQGQMPQQPVGGMPPSAGPSGALFDSAGEGREAQGGAHGNSGNDISLGEEELVNLTLNERNVLAGLQGGQASSNQPIGAPGDAGLRDGLPEAADLEQDSEGFRARLEEFNKIRAERAAAQAAAIGVPTAAPEIEDDQAAPEEPSSQQAESAVPSRKGKGKKRATEDGGLSLTQQVQQTQAAVAAAQTTEPDMPMPFPPPSSTTPLPAPTAQRARSNLPEQYNRSRSGSPDDEQSTTTQPPPLAPWAKEPGNDAHKGPSLKAIQEAEARKAAKAEEAAAAVRKAALEQEAALFREKEKQAASAAAGLPASSTWGHASPVSGGSPWVKPGAAKAPAPGLSATTSASSKKTLAEIQREEESRKQKAKVVALQSGAPVSTSKSYANLAGKTGQPSIPSAPSPGAPAGPSGAGWATVGAGGKVKIPTGPAAQNRPVSANSAKPPSAPIKPVSRPGPATGPSNEGPTDTAMDEFRKWAQRELSRGLNVNDSESFSVMFGEETEGH